MFEVQHAEAGRLAVVEHLKLLEVLVGRVADDLRKLALERSDAELALMALQLEAGLCRD
jgi:hypothetical protein